MKLLTTLSLIIAFAGASPVLAEAPAKAPAEKKAPPADKPATKTLSPDETKKAVAFFEELHAAIIKNQDACPKMATALNAVIDKHGAWLKKMAGSDKDLPQAEKDKLATKQNEMMTAVMKCKDDKAVAAAFQRFMTITTKQPPAK
jgi:hypothetical protein